MRKCAVCTACGEDGKIVFSRFTRADALIRECAKLPQYAQRVLDDGWKFTNGGIVQEAKHVLKVGAMTTGISKLIGKDPNGHRVLMMLRTLTEAKALTARAKATVALAEKWHFVAASAPYEANLNFKNYGMSLDCFPGERDKHHMWIFF